MIEVAIMIEGQNGLTWPLWQRIAQAVESLGFVGLYRSDHFTNAHPPDRESLELWVSLTWLASHTERIEFGPMVSPVSFRQPTMTARMASAVDDLSGGRLILGMGAGWQSREHDNYSWDLLNVSDRLDRFEEGLEVVTKLLNSDEPVDFHGKYYRLNDAILLPRPHRPGGPVILVGGNGWRRTLPLAARYAREWNGVYLSPEKFASLNQHLDELIIARNRRPESVRRSLMNGLAFGRDEAEVLDKMPDWFQGKSFEELRQGGVLVGTGPQISDQLKEFEDAGVQRIMLQWLDLEDLDRLEAFAEFVLA